MNIKTLGNAIAVACTCVVVSPAWAIEFNVHDANYSPAFDSSGDTHRAGTKPWHAYSDPGCDSVDVSSMSFHTTVHGAKPAGRDLDKPHAAFGGGSKVHFDKPEKFDVSHFNGYSHHSHWKPEPMGDYCTPVPEPQTYAMLIMGLGALTFVARRRKPALK